MTTKAKKRKPVATPAAELPLTRLIPRDDRVVLLPLDDNRELMTPGGLVLPQTSGMSSEPARRGVVLAVGPGRPWLERQSGEEDVCRWPTGLAVGDTVVFAAFAGVDIREDDRELKVIRSEDIIAVLNTD